MRAVLRPPIKDFFLPGPDLRQIAISCYDVYSHFHQLHAELPLLISIPAPAPEIYTMIESFFERDQFKQYDPTAVFIATYNFFELNASEYFEAKGLPVPAASDRVVVGLPYADHSNPLLWCALAHEMGHAFEKKHNVAETVVAIHLSPEELEILQSWTKEFVSDQIGLRVLGPAYLNSFFALTLTDHPTGFTPSESHPQLHTRLKLMAQHLRGQGILTDSVVGHLGIFEDLVAEFDVAEHVGPYEETTLCPSCTESVDVKIPAPAIPLADLWAQVSRFLGQLDDFRKLTSYGAAEAEPVMDLVSLLESGQPISAYRNVNEAEILEDVQRLANNADERAKLSRDELYKLLKRIEEKPASVSQILNAGWEFRWRNHVKSFREAFKDSEVDLDERAKAYNKHLARLDYLLQKSIESSQLHRMLRRI